MLIGKGGAEPLSLCLGRYLRWGIVICSLGSAVPAWGNGTLGYEGTLKEHRVESRHTRAGCPGRRYPLSVATIGANETQIRIPSDFSCEVMSFGTGRLTLDMPKEGLKASLPDAPALEPTMVGVDNAAEKVAKVKISGTMRYSDDGDEVHKFRVMAALESLSCGSDFSQENWSTESRGTKAMQAEASCPTDSLPIVPGSLEIVDGVITKFRAEVVSRVDAEMGHEIPWPLPGFRGGVYQVEVRSIYEFELKEDKVTITEAQPDPSEELMPEAMQGFEAEIEYELVSADEAELWLGVFPMFGSGRLAQADPLPVQRGKNTVRMSVPAFQLPEKDGVILQAYFVDASNRIRSPSNKIIYTIANDLVVDHIEVVQVVQNPTNTLPLVAGKSTMVRVFTKLKYDGPAKWGVPSRLRAFRNGAELEGSPINTSGMTAFAVFRGQASGSHNFYVPRAWAAAGDTRLVAEVNPDRTITEPDYDNNQGETTVKFRRRRSFAVKYIKVCMETAGVRTCPGATIGSKLGFMRKIFPVADNGLSYKAVLGQELTWYGPFNTPATKTGIIGKLRSKYNELIALNPAEPMDQLIGWIPIGFTKSGPNSHTTGRSDPTWANGTGRVAFAADTQSWGDPLKPAKTLAHEIAHNLGLQHPPTADSGAPSGYGGWPYGSARINEHGWDPLGRAFKKGLPPFSATAKFDFMSYGNPPSKFWISPHYFLKLFNGNFVPGRNPPATIPAGIGVKEVPSTTRLANGTRELAVVGGAIRRDGAGAQLDPMFRILSEAEASVSTPSGAYCLEFSDVGGSGLSSYCFDVTFRDVDTMAELDQQSFSALVEWPAGTARMALTTNGQELASVAASSTAPTVEFTSPVGGDQWQGGTSQAVAWTASDVDGDPMSFDLFYSPDGETSWAPLAADLTTTQHIVNPAVMQGGNMVHLRLFASDGFHTSVATVGPITVMQNPEIDVQGPIDVGEIMAGASRAVSIPVSNSGTGPLTVQSATVDNPVFEIDLPVTPMLIPAGDVIDIQLRYTPTAVGGDSGTLTFTSDAITNPSLAVAVQGTGTDGQTPAIEVARSPLMYVNIPAGGTHTATIRVQNASQVDLDVNWTVSGTGFSAGEAEASFTLAELEETDLVVHFLPEQAGDYNGTVVITSNDPDDQRIEIGLRGQAYADVDRPVAFDGGVVDAARARGVVAPGGIATIYGTGLGDSVMQASDTPLPTKLLGIEVLVNGIAAPLYFVSPGQINFQIPFEVPNLGELTVVVLKNSVASYSSRVAVADFAPAMFMNLTSGEPIIQRHSDGSVISSSNPAVAGEILTLYLTGVGGVTNPPRTGEPTPADPLAWATSMPSVTVGGAAATVYYCGLSPFYIGLAQIDIRLPDALPDGPTAPLVISFPEAEDETVDMPVN